MKIGLLGGSFDPIHDGHVLMAKEAYRQLGLDEVWFIPTADTPLKDRKLTCYEDRVEMIYRAIQPYRHFKVSRIEECMDGKNYTINTIRKLNEMHPNYTFYFMIGADQVAQLDRWKDIDALQNEVHLCAFMRDGMDVNSPYKVRKLSMKPHPASSTKVRNGKYGYVCESVRKYMIKHHLYLDFVKDAMSEFRYEHSLSVANLSVKIARANHMDEEKAWLCGLLHDINKEYKMIDFEASKKVLAIMKPELLEYKEQIWHGYMGRFVLEHCLQIRDKKLLMAVENHVLGECKSSYAKLIYVADKLDPRRNYDTTPGIEACCRNLNEGFEFVKSQQKTFYGEEFVSGK